MKLINPFESFKFWASKPLDTALAYLDKYGKKPAVLLDPFAGSGVFVYAALLRGLKAIYNDLCPYALFLARNVMLPVQPETLQEAFDEVLKRPIDIDILSEDGSVVISKGTPIEDVIKWFYLTTCDFVDEEKGKCGREVVADYILWDTEYIAPKTLADDYAYKKALKGDQRYRLFIDTICNTVTLDINGKATQCYAFTTKDVNDKWEIAFDKDPEIWLEKRERGKKEQGAVNQVRAVLIREVFSRNRRYPILKRIKCPIHGSLTQPLNDDDYRKIEIIEKMIYPWQDFIPNIQLTYERDGKTIPFHQTRLDQIFVKERMSTMEESEFKERLPKLKHCFTKRNLIALTALFWSIFSIKDQNIREQLYLVFVSNLHMNAKFDRLGNYGRWATGYYASLDDFKENNVLNQLLNGWREVKIAKETVWQQNSGVEKFVFDETWDVKDFLQSLNEPNKKNVLWLRTDARKLNEHIGRKIVDIVFTDPPYRGEAESVQYFELTAFYTGWLCLDKNWVTRYGDFSWWKDEVIENEEQGKDMLSYYSLLRQCFASIDAIVKEGAKWIITYHSPNKEVWEGVRDVLITSTGLEPPTYEQVQTHKIRAKGVGTFYVTRFGSIGEDAYIVLSKRRGITPKPKAKLTEREFLGLLLKKMKQEIVRNRGIVDWEMFQAHFPAIVLKHGDLFSDTKSYKDFFYSVTIPLAGNARIFDRDKIGEELYQLVYGKISPKALLTRALTICGEGQKEISRAEMDLKILPKMDGRVSNKTRTYILKQLFTYDPIGNKYIFKGHRLKTLERWFPKTKRVTSVPLLMPQELVLKIEEAAKKYGGHAVKELRLNFQLLIEVRGIKFLININDEPGVRRFGAGAPTDEKKDTYVVFLYYSLAQNQLSSLASILTPAKLIAVPYIEYQKVVDAFRKYNPEEKLSSFIINA